MRPWCAGALTAVLCGALSGCATGNGARTASNLFRSPAAVTKQGKDKPAPVAESRPEPPRPDSPESLEKTHNPFRTAKVATTSRPDTKTTPESAPAKIASQDVKPVVATGSDGKPEVTTADFASSFPPESLQLINAELADATPQERAYWYEQLKRVDAAVIPQILQARRLTAEIVEKQHADHAIDDPSPHEPEPLDRPSPKAVTHAVEQRLPGSQSSLNAALYQTDGLPHPGQIIPQNFESAAAPARPNYAVQRISGTTAPQPAAPPAALPNNPSARNALSRFLPTGRGGQQPTATANNGSPVSLLPPTPFEHNGHWQSRLDPLISQLEAEAAQLTPGMNDDEQADYIQRHVFLRLMYLMAQHPERALTAIPGIAPADQEFWQQTVWAMANYFDREHIPSAKDRAGQAVIQLTAASQRLREKADLEVRNLAFCQEIAYFGNFTRFPRDEFHPGDSALLYAEIENFKSELTVDGQYRTLLRSTIEIVSPSGEVRWQKEFPATEDLCLNYRRDYFHNYQFTIPDRLPMGPQTLKLTIFDELSGKVVSQSLKFIVR